MKLIRRGALIGIGLLFIMAIPWFWDPNEKPEIIFGLPDWAAWSLLCFIGVAVLNAISWTFTDLDGDAGDGP
tara:strand:+ start:151 stop:366 length:216 start_codon:yes stop_codon:yes gene_type:complete